MLIPIRPQEYKDITKPQPEFETLKLCAKSVRAAILFAAKNDVRYYLNGILLDHRGYIVATNGHVMIRIENEECKRLSKDQIIGIKGAKIPAKANYLDLISDSNKGGFVRFSVGHGLADIQEARLFEVIDGKYPDIDRVVPTSDLQPTDKIGINPEYVALVGKAQNELSYSGSCGAEFKFRGPNNAIEVDIDNGIKAKIIIMTCRLQGK